MVSTLASTPLGVGGEGGVAEEIGGEKRVGDGLAGRVGVLLSRSERAGGGIGDGVEREAEREPGDDSAMSPPSPVGASKTPAASRTAARPGGQRELRKAEQPDPDHLAGEQVARPYRREDQLHDAVVLLLDDAGDHPLAVDGERHEEEKPRADVRDERRCVGRSRPREDGASPRSAPAPEAAGCGGRAPRCRRRRPPWRRRSSGRRAGPADSSRSASTFLSSSSLASGRRRSDQSQPHLRVVERLRGALQARREAGGRRGRHRDAVGRRLRERALERRRAADEQEHDQRRDEERLAAQPLADLAPGDEP